MSESPLVSLKNRAPIIRRKGRASSGFLPWLLCMPTMILIFSLSVFPLLYALSISFQYNMLTDLTNSGFIGFDNYRMALADPFVFGAIKTTFVFTIIALLIELPLGTAIAFLLFKKFPLQGIARMLLLAPMACAPLAIGLIWRSMYHADFGVFTYVLTKLNIISDANLLGNPKTALGTIIIMDTWQWTPFIVFLILAALQSLPKEPYEAAQIDGASRWKIFSKLTFPLILPTIFVAFLLRLLDLIRYYDGIYALTAGGPGTATESITWYLYRIGFKYMDMGYASSISVLFLFVTIIISILALKVILKDDSSKGRA